MWPTVRPCSTLLRRENRSFFDTVIICHSDTPRLWACRLFEIANANNLIWFRDSDNFVAARNPSMLPSLPGAAFKQGLLA